MVDLQKISVDIDPMVYTNLKQDAFRRRITMAKIIRQMLDEKYKEEK